MPGSASTGSCYAVCVGINNYQTSLRSLRYAEKDAEDMYHLFLNRGFPQNHCCLLLGKEATTDAIRAKLAEFVLSEPQKDDLVIFYFAGHGEPILLPNEDELYSDVFLTSYNIDCSLLETKRGAWLEYPLRLQKLRNDFFEQTLSRKVLFLLDSCHSGDFFGKNYRSAQLSDPQQLIQQTFAAKSTGRVALSSCLPHQPAYEDEQTQHGQFTHHLLQALDGKARRAVLSDGTMTVNSLFDYLADVLPENQRPVLSGVQHGSFTLWYFSEFDESHTPPPSPTEQGLTKKQIQKLIQEEFKEWEARKSKSLKEKPFIPPQQDDPKKFTGRTEEMKQLEHLLLHSEEPRIAGVIGTGGMGKSTLASHFASKYRDHFPDGVIGLNVEGRDPATLAQIFAEFAHSNLNSRLSLKTGEIMQRAFQHKRALLIFDNFDDPLPDENAQNKELNPKLRELLPGGECAVIITTRDYSKLASFGLSPQTHITLGSFTLAETRSLLTKLLREEQVSAEPEAVEAIHKLVGGLPLALRIIAGTLNEKRFLSLAECAEELSDERKRLSELQYEDLDIRTSFNISLKLLNTRERRLFACLSACAKEGFTRTICEVVSNQSKDEVNKGMAKLYRLSLINLQPGTNRFTLHPLLHDLACELARDEKLLDIAWQRHTDYFVSYVQLHKQASRMEYMDAIAREIDAVILTIRRLLAVNLERGVEFYIMVEPFFQQRGHWKQALDLIDERLQIARKRGDFYNIAQSLLQRGQFLKRQGDFSSAEKTLQEARQTCLHIDDTRQKQRSQTMVLNSLGEVYEKLRRFDEAIEVLRQSALIEDQMKNPRGKGIVLHTMGTVYQKQKMWVKAGKKFLESYTLLQDNGDREGEAMVLNSLAVVYRKLHQLDDAEIAAKRSIEIGEDLRLDNHLAMARNTLGEIYLDQGKPSEAIPVLNQSLEQRIWSDDKRGEAITLCALGQASLALGDLEQAIAHLQDSFHIEANLKHINGLCIVTPILVEALRQAGRNKDARKLCEQAAKLAPHERRLRQLKADLP